MEIKIVEMAYKGHTLGQGLDDKRCYIDKKGELRVASCYEIPSTRDVCRFYEKIDEALNKNGKLISTEKKDDLDTMTCGNMSCFLADGCLVENFLTWGEYHQIKIAGKPDDVDKIVKEKPGFLMAYKVIPKSYEIHEDLNLESFKSVSKLEEKLSCLQAA